MGNERVYIDKVSRQAYLDLVRFSRTVRETAIAAGLEPGVVELINVRVSQINGCAFCLDKHVRDALTRGESTQRLAVLPAWRDTALFSAQERAALALAETVTRLPDNYSQDRDYDEASRHLSTEQLAAVIWIAIAMSAFNRVSILSRHPVRPEHAASPERAASPEQTTVPPGERAAHA